MDRGCRSRSKVEKEAQYGKPQDPDDGGRNDDGDDYHVDDDDDNLQDHVHLPEARKAFVPD